MDVFAAEGIRAEFDDDGRVHAAAYPYDGLLHARLADTSAYEIAQGIDILYRRLPHSGIHAVSCAEYDITLMRRGTSLHNSTAAG